MDDKEIIESFFTSGCCNAHGEPLPLRNCEKIKYLYERDLEKAGCCTSGQREVYLLYYYRMQEFLRIEKSRE